MRPNMSNTRAISDSFFEVPEDLVRLLGPEGQYVRTWAQYDNFFKTHRSFDMERIRQYYRNNYAREVAQR